MVTPMSVLHRYEDRRFVASAAPLAVRAVGVAPPLWLGVIGRLAGRLFRWRTWLGPPKVGLRGKEKSTLVRHCMDILGWHSSDTHIVAPREISKT